MKKPLYFSLLLFAAVSLSAALPSGSAILEAEELSSGSKSWVSRPHYSDWYRGYPSSQAHLDGSSALMEPAEGSLDAAKAGKHRLWVRYLDLAGSHRKHSGFRIVLNQGGKELCRKDFDREDRSLRDTEAGLKRWGSGYGRFVWDSLDVTVPQAGKIILQLGKLFAEEVTSHGGRHIDVFVLTPDLQYQPDIQDLHSWYFRVRILPEQPSPIAIHLFGKRSNSSKGWYMNHSNVNRKGWFMGPNNGAGNMKEHHFQAGDVSPWYNLTRELTFDDADKIQFSAMTSYFVPRPSESWFEIQFSTTPDEKGLRKTYTRKAGGCGLGVSINSYKGLIVSEIEASQADLERARKAVPHARPRPRLYPFATSLSLTPDVFMPATISRELQALEHIGINTLPPECLVGNDRFPWFSGANFCFNYAQYDARLKQNCLGRPKHQDILSSMESFVERLKQAGDPGRLQRVIMTDEPCLDENHPVECPYCRDHFQEYLKSMHVSLSGQPTIKPEDGLRYYWTMRYRNHIHMEMMRAGTDALQKALPNAPAAVNFGISLVFSGNLVSAGCDWFEIFGSNALTYGWGEDWANFCNTYQVGSYYDAVLRAACRPRGRKFGMYDILGGRSEWEIQTKAYMHMGQGASCLHFFNYGPDYAISTDTNNRRPEIYRAISRVTGTTALIEEALVKSRSVRGEAAQLVSVTSDIWNQFRGNYFGKERMFFNLLLTHCDYRIDILSEQDLDSQLNRYRLLFVNDSHLLQKQVKPLLKWLAAGGTLYLGPGALERNEADRPLGFLEEVNLKREPVQMTEEPGRPQYDLKHKKSLGKYQDINLICIRQEPLYQVVPYHRGKIIASGFFPGLSYMKESTHREQDPYSVRSYPQTHRRYIRHLPLPVRPVIQKDKYLIETQLLKSDTDHLLVFSNWTGLPQTVRLKFRSDAKYGELIPAGIKILEKHIHAKGLLLKLQIEEGGFLRCRLANSEN